MLSTRKRPPPPATVHVLWFHCDSLTAEQMRDVQACIYPAADKMCLPGQVSPGSKVQVLRLWWGKGQRVLTGSRSTGRHPTPSLTSCSSYTNRHTTASAQDPHLQPGPCNSVFPEGSAGAMFRSQMTIPCLNQHLTGAPFECGGWSLGHYPQKIGGWELLRIKK